MAGSPSAPASRVVVLGDSGVGKTLLCERLASAGKAPRRRGWTWCRCLLSGQALSAPTVGVDVRNAKLKSGWVELVDVAGCTDEAHVDSLQGYLTGVDAVLLVCDDVTPGSQEHLASVWLPALMAANTPATEGSCQTSSGELPGLPTDEISSGVRQRRGRAGDAASASRSQRRASPGSIPVYTVHNLHGAGKAVADVGRESASPAPSSHGGGVAVDGTPPTPQLRCDIARCAEAEVSRITSFIENASAMRKRGLLA